MQIQRRTTRPILTFVGVLCIAIVAGLSLYFFMPRDTTTPTNKDTSTEKKVVKKSNEKKTQSTPAFNKRLYSIDTPGSLWWIVNKQRPAGQAYIPTNLVTPSVMLNTGKSAEENSILPEVAPHLESLFGAAKTQGHSLMFASGYRSYTLQNTYYTHYVATSGQTEADRYSARPGTSEHQTGLSLDVATVDRVHYLDQAFGTDPAGKWLAEHAHEYGFIIRYPEGKESVTGYMYEPWHIRYVGKDLATQLYTNKQTMEEFFNLI